MATSAVGYDAFISYGHGRDGTLAPTVQTLVERFATPWYRPRALRLFRDSASLSANPDLWSSIESALLSSRWLVLMASPDAARSPWVDREIAWWLAHKSAEQLLIVLTAGEFRVAGDSGSSDDAALPPSLAPALVDEPRWVDLRPHRDAGRSDEGLRGCVADIAAAIHEMPKDMLVGEHIRQHRRTMRLARGGGAALALLAVVALVASVVAVGQGGEARTQRDSALFSQILRQAEQLRAVDVSLAAQLNALAYRRNPTPDAYTALVSSGNQARSTPLAGHTAPVRSVAFGAGGGWLASGAEDSTIQVRDPDDAATAVLSLGDDGTIANSLASGPGGGLLVAGLTDGTVRLWNLADPRVPRAIGDPLRTDTADPVVAVALSPDGRTLATGDSRNRLRLWDIADPAQPRLADAVLTGNWGLAFRPDGRVLAGSDATDGSVRLWDMTDPLRPTPLGTAVIGKPAEIVYSVAFSPDGSIMASGGTDTNVQLWDVADPAAPVVVGTFVSPGNAVTSLDVSKDGMLAIGSGDGSIALVNLAVPAQPWFLDGHGALKVASGYVLSVEFSPDGRQVVSGYSDGALRLWDVPDSLLGSTSATQSVRFGPDGRTVAAAGEDGLIRIWDTGEPGPPALLQGSSGIVWSVAFSPDGRTLVGSDDSGAVLLWDLAAPDTAPRTVATEPAPVYAVAFSPDGRTLAAAGSAVRLWDLADPTRPATTLIGSAGVAQTVVVGADGRTVAAGYTDDTIAVWDLDRQREPPQVLRGHTESVNALDVSPDGRLLASGSSDQSVRLWDITDPGRSTGLDTVLIGHTNTVLSVAFSPDGLRLASGGLDRTVRFWDVGDPAGPGGYGEPLILGPPTATGGVSVVSAVAYSPDGAGLAIAGSDLSVRIWDLDPDSLVRRICATAANNLTQESWRRYFGDQPYQPPACG